MKERPVIFSAPMVRAILEGRKTQTRRIVKPYLEGERLALDLWEDGIVRKCPYGQPGDRLWVRETWGKMQEVDGGAILYRADFIEEEVYPILKGWRPSIYMPREASRILLEITDVRVERLQEITESDGMSEGVLRKSPLYWQSYLGGDRNTLSARDSFWTLWHSIHGPDSWDQNPWVWVITFKRIQS